MKNINQYFGTTIVIFVCVAVILFTGYNAPGINPPAGSDVEQTPITSHVVEVAEAKTNKAKLVAPISKWQDRVTKKPFSIFVSPQNSPLEEENFYGYHTGVDFEILDGEADTAISVYAVCTGALVQKKSASGYGGVVVQRCNLDGGPITVIYGHLNIKSVKLQTNKQIKAGQQIGMLGKGFSEETDGQRKHLHLGIHKGAQPNILGYVNTKSQLDSWLDALQFLEPDAEEVSVMPN